MLCVKTQFVPTSHDAVCRGTFTFDQPTIELGDKTVAAAVTGLTLTEAAVVPPVVVTVPHNPTLAIAVINTSCSIPTAAGEAPPCYRVCIPNRLQCWHVLQRQPCFGGLVLTGLGSYESHMAVTLNLQTSTDHSATNVFAPPPLSRSSPCCLC